MPNEGNSPSDEEVTTTPHGEDGTDEATDDLAWGEPEETEDVHAKISRLEKIVMNQSKGIQKFMSQQGRKQTVEPRTPTTPPSSPTGTSDVEVLFFESKPEAERVKDDLQKIAKLQGISILQVWKNEPWLQEKSKALAEEEKRKERDAQRVLPPSGAAVVQKDFATMSDEEAMKLPPLEYEKFVKAKSDIR